MWSLKTVLAAPQSLQTRPPPGDQVWDSNCEVWKSLSIKWSAGSIKRSAVVGFLIWLWLLLAMISRFVHWINWLPFQSVFPNNPSPASNALVLGSQVLRCAKLHAAFFNIFLVSNIFVKQRRIPLLQKALLPFDVRNLARPGWTYLTVKTNWMFLDFLRRNYSTNSKDLPHFSKWKSSESSDRPNSLWPSSPSKPIA